MLFIEKNVTQVSRDRNSKSSDNLVVDNYPGYDRFALRYYGTEIYKDKSEEIVLTRRNCCGKPCSST